ncbi:hypothetical protein B9Z55_008917 [Caenorhabditis nigoni]|uniref:SH3 domain-containing protein n=1 Tax=Caenorhabditis nigoni TaxID=1611254 RepID=A0A2G5UPU9_9PELO|nr:hypothetical protein B9Z55_008917 [Caenorhabditis nigoni]
MEPPKWSGVILALIVLIHAGYTAKQAVVSRKSKLCGNTECEEVLFKARVKRVMGINNDPSFLNLAENAIISVVAVKFSDRPDIMEGKLNGEGPSGFFYAGAIDILPFAEFLRSAIDEKKEMLMISQNPADTGDKRIVGFLHSETDLVRDYNAKNAQAAAENGLPAPEPLPIPEPAHSGGHGHSHGGHGHSHGGHGHSHGAPKAQEVPETAKIPAENAPEVVKMPDLVPKIPEESAQNAQKMPDLTPETAQKAPEVVPNLQNVLGSAPNPPKMDPSDMEKEIERLIAEEQERMAKSPEEPLILSSLPVETATVTQETIAQPTDSQTAPEASTVPQEPAIQPTEPIAQPTPAPEDIPLPTVTPAPELSPEAIPPIAQYIPPTTTVPPPIAQEPEATVTPTIAQQQEEPATTVSPIAEDPATVSPIAQQPEEPTTVPPPTIPETQALPVQQDELTTPPTPPESVTTPPEAAPESHHAHAHDVHGHSHSEDVVAAPEATTVPPAASPEEEEFLKWEEERRQKREAEQSKPYEDAQGHHYLPPTPPPTSSGILEAIRSSLGLENVSDGSILMYINLTFVLASLVFYIIVRSLSSGGDSTDISDRQAYFELVTKHKQLLLQLQTKEAEIKNIQQNGVQQQQQPQQQQMPNHEPELLALREQVQNLQNELQTSLNQRRDFEIHYNQLRDAAEQKESTIAQLNETANDYKERLQKASDEIQDWARQLDTTRAELNELQQTAYGRQQEAIERRQQEGDEYEQKIQELTSEKKALAGRIQNLEEDFERVSRQLDEERELNSGLQGTVQRLETELEASKTDAAESGGSGWSDCGDIEDVEKEKDLQKVLEDDENLQKAQKEAQKEVQEELSRLKLKLEQSEKEVQRYRNLYERQNETESRGAIEVELKLKNAETEVLESKKKIEELVGEKKELGDRLNEMLKNLNSTMSKAADNDKMFTTLRDESFAKDKQLLETDAVIRKKDEKIRELDASVKRIEREYLKLEAKSFHDVMSLKKQLDDYKSAQILSGGGPPGSRDVFPGNTNSQNQNRPISRTDRGLAPSPLDEPIWDEPEPYVPNQQLGGNPHESDYYSSGSMSMGRRRSTRRSHLVQAESPSDQEKSTSSKSNATKKEGVVHRRRSRSTGGRQYPQYVDQYSLTNQYMPGSSDSSFLSMGGATVGGAPGGFQPLSNRHSRSGHLSGGGGGGHYSSGGSNGGRSPPPEMPLLGAIPPIGARKPMIKRPGEAEILAENALKLT